MRGTFCILLYKCIMNDDIMSDKFIRCLYLSFFSGNDILALMAGLKEMNEPGDTAGALFRDRNRSD